MSRCFLTLSFNDEKERDIFVGGLLDGWGENWCEFDHAGSWLYHLRWCDGFPCPHCDRIGGTPIRIESRDDSVGYLVEEERCSLCVPYATKGA